MGVVFNFIFLILRFRASKGGESCLGLGFASAFTSFLDLEDLRWEVAEARPIKDLQEARKNGRGGSGQRHGVTGGEARIQSQVVEEGEESNCH